MCIPLIGRVLALDGERAQVELVGGEIVRVDPVLHPTVASGDHVLIDRGLIIEVIDAAQAESMLAFFRELEALWDAEEAGDA